MQVVFSQHSGSSQWEPLPIARVPGLTLWAWYRPQQLPASVTINIPATLIPSFAGGFPFSVADLLLAAGVTPEQFQSVSLFGGGWQAAAIFGPFLNHPIPACGPGLTPEIRIAVLESAAATPQVASQMHEPSGVGGAGTEEPSSTKEDTLYDRIESTWRSSIQMERQMVGLRQKLSTVLAALGKLDRELAPEERIATDREDRDAWEDARRWARDLAGKCHREIKSFDIGMTSAAGRRNWIEQMFNQFIEPRAYHPNLEDVRREFETYRKDIVNLQKSMTAALQAATQNGTARSNRVLATIGKKIKARRAKMRAPIAGINMDRSCRRST